SPILSTSLENRMRVLAFSDLHRSEAAARAILQASAHADVGIGAGDFGTKGQGTADTIKVLAAITVPSVFVPGNHDYSDDLLTACRDWPLVHILHGTAVTIEGATFFGLGFDVPGTLDAPWNKRMSEDEAADLLARCPRNAVLVTHSPPLG